MSSVSVIVPTRNRSGLLTTTLQSVLQQRGVEFEVIVVDDASTDDTAAVVASLADPRVRLIRQPVPTGPSAARNRGAGRARGAWVAFVDDDDVWAPDKLARQVTTAEKAGQPWVYAGTVNVGGELEIVSGSPPPAPEDVSTGLPRYNPIPGGGSNVIVRRSLFEESGGFDERFPPCEDWELWARLARSGPPASVAAPLVGYRLHSGSHSLDTKRILRSAQLIEQVHGRVDWGRLHRWLAESSLRNEEHVRALGHFARAALRGQIPGVAADLAAILRRRLPRRMGGYRHDGDPTGEAWFRVARPWLDELRSAPSYSTEEVGHP